MLQYPLGATGALPFASTIVPNFKLVHAMIVPQRHTHESRRVQVHVTSTVRYCIAARQHRCYSGCLTIGHTLSGSTTGIESTMFFCGYRRIGPRLRSVAHDVARSTAVGSHTQESPKVIQQSVFAVSLNSSSLVKTHSQRSTLTYTTFVPQSIPIIDENLDSRLRR